MRDNQTDRAGLEVLPFEECLRLLASVPVGRVGFVTEGEVVGHGIDVIHSFGDAQHLARQLPDARLIRTRTFAELWVQPARLTAEITEFLDRVWADGTNNR